MKIGLQLPNFTWSGGREKIGPTILAVARAAEAAGFDSLWVMDHFFQMEVSGGPELDMLESYTTLGYCAAVTSRMKLGVMATGVVYRHPGILLKTVTTLDVLSGGRAYLGIGASWYQREATGLGVPFPSLAERFERLEETLQIAKQMWSGKVAPFDGKHFRLEETLCLPQPMSRPHPPILVAGGGEKKTLRLAAQYGDACNVYGDAAAVAPKFETLKRHCEAIGRNYDSIEKTALHSIIFDSGRVASKQMIALCRSLAEIGTDHILFPLSDAQNEAAIEVFAREIIPAAAAF
jgi:F420-dependent oxidoreductase-like protein